MGWSDQVENDVSKLRDRVNWLTALVTQSLVGKRVKIACIRHAFKPGVGGCKGSYRHVIASDVSVTVKNYPDENCIVLVEFEYNGETLHAWVNLEEITPIEEESK